MNGLRLLKSKVLRCFALRQYRGARGSPALHRWMSAADRLHITRDQLGQTFLFLITLHSLRITVSRFCERYSVSTVSSATHSKR